MRLRLLVLAVVAPVALWAILPVLSEGQTPGQIQSKINRKQSLIGGHKAHERVLTSDIEQYTDRIHALEGDIDKLSARQHKLQTSLDAKREELAAVQAKLRTERARLARLKARLLLVRRTLAQRLVALSKADHPDSVTVVLNSNGFEDLLERTEFMHRISQQDAHIMDVVRTAKADATSTEARLSTLEKTEAHVAAQIQQQRDQVS